MNEESKNEKIDEIEEIEEITEVEDDKKSKKKKKPDNDIKLSKKETIGILLYLVIAAVAILLINSFYFSNDKESPMVSEDNFALTYPSKEDVVQVFCTPNDRTKGITVYCVPDENPDSYIIVYLLATNGMPLNEWTIHSSDIVDEEYYLSFEGIDISEGENYYLKAWTDQDNSIAIYTGESSAYGYGSIGLNNRNWVYSIRYSAKSPYVYSMEFAIILLGLIAFLLYKKGTKEVTILSLLFASIALIFFILTPYNSLFDEEGHFLRSFEISEGHMVSGKADNGAGVTRIPAKLYNGITNVTKALNYEDGAHFLYARQDNLMEHNFLGDYISVDNPNQALYSPASYIPQSIGLVFAGMVTKNVFLFYGIGRFFAFIINTLLVIWAIHLVPEKKILMLAMALNPIFLAQMVSYSADGTLNSLALFYVAYLFMLRKKEKINIIHKVLVFILSIVIALSKVIYFPFVLLVFLMNEKGFSSKVGAGIYKIFTFVASMAAGVIWFFIAKSYLFDTVSAGVAPDAQFKYILSHIYLAPQIAFNTIIENFEGWMCQLFGGVFGQGWFLYTSVIWLIFGFVVVVELFFTRNPEEEHILVEKKEKLLIAVSLILIIGLTFASLYVQWTPYQANMIRGIQGRYFIPLVLPLGLIVKRKYVRGKEINREIAEILFLLFAVLLAAVNTVQAYV